MGAGVTALLLALTLLVPFRPTWADRHLLWLVNHARTQAGLEVLEGSLVLDREADRRAAYIARHGIRHEIVGVGFAWDEVPASYPWRMAGEVLGALNQPSAPWVLGMWMRSRTHQAVLLGSWRQAGAAQRTIGGETYFVVLFAR